MAGKPGGASGNESARSGPAHSRRRPECSGLGYFVLVRSGEASEGRELYAANCASCHGANLEGHPDWMKRLPSGRLPAPPHDETGHTWHHSDKQLSTIVKFGLGAISPGYESDS